MDTINVVWASYNKPEILARGYWDQGMLEDMFQARGPFQFNHTENIADVPKGEGAVFIINGRTHTKNTKAINVDISRLAWCLFIDTGDEEAVFPWREIKHPRMAVWVMLPRMNQHDDVSFHMPNGYRPQTRRILKEIGELPRDIGFFFAGQVTHERRQQCLEAAVQLKDRYNGVIVTTKSFGEEKVPYDVYLRNLARSNVALCPSGPETPDNFRLYEALEAGCVPIVDAFSTNHKHPGFWQYLFGNDVPFPVLNYWDELSTVLPQVLSNWDELSVKVSVWWQKYKRDMHDKLISDIKELSK